MNKRKTSQNRLSKSQSPYLLQHASNPVDWFPWSDEAFKKAKDENKPIFLSIGYSTCHWCHVMEHESFEDSTVAKLMNESFVNLRLPIGKILSILINVLTKIKIFTLFEEIELQRE